MNSPTFSFEQGLWEKGFKHICGVDEVGRGSFAGPVFAGAVVFAPFSSFQFPIFNKFSKRILINDSKRLTAKQREAAASWIKENAIGWGVGSASVGQINRLGIKKATEVAYRRAIRGVDVLVSNIEYLLIDAFYIPNVRGLGRGKQLPIVKGDNLSFTIAAASIIAKVARDEYMSELGKQAEYRNYYWGKNKGYGTRDHRTAINCNGATVHHRTQFINNYLPDSKSRRN